MRTGSYKNPTMAGFDKGSEGLQGEKRSKSCLGLFCWGFFKIKSANKSPNYVNKYYQAAEPVKV